MGDDNPYSLFLALGIPFEVIDEPASEGFTFLSDADAKSIGHSPSSQALLVARPRPGLPSQVRPVTESLPELMAFKRGILPQLEGVPYIEGERPVVCAWYPTARAALVWNLGERREQFLLRFRNRQRSVTVDGLEVAMIEDLGE